MKDLILVGIGGFFGSIARYGAMFFFVKTISEKAFYGTLMVNLIGSFTIGLLIGWFDKISGSVYLLLVIGFCGGFTTFSTFSMDGIRLLKSGLGIDFLIYALSSIVGSLLLCYAGFTLVSKIS